MTPHSFEPVIHEVWEERVAQDVEWGGPSHDDEHDAVDWTHFISHQLYLLRSEYWHNHAGGAERKRFIKIAALAVAAIESIDRKEKANGI